MKWLEVLDEAVDWVASAYPEEGCGLVLQRGEHVRFLGCRNLAHPSTTSHRYVIDPMELVRADDRGETLTAIVHSHVDVGDYFSDEDIAAALLPRAADAPLEPAHPGVDYLVISVRSAGPDHASAFRFAVDSAHGFRKVWGAAL